MGHQQCLQQVLLQKILMVFISFYFIHFSDEDFSSVESSFAANLAAAYSGLASPVAGNNNVGALGVKEQSPENNSLGFQIPNPDIFLGSSGMAILI
jgi:hypothetical protein